MRSSAMASAVRNTFSDTGTLSPRMERVPTAKAISVAVGIPQPEEASVPWLTRAKMAAGITTPPKAAITGRIAFLKEESSPHTTSRLISRPTVKKKITMRMSLMNFSMVIPCGKNQSTIPSGDATWIVSSVCRKL